MFKQLIMLAVACLVTVTVHAHERHKVRPQGVMSVDVQQQGDKVHMLLGKQHGDFQSLWYQKSNDKGKTWQQPVLIKDKFKAKFNRGNDARLAVQGDKLVAVWMSWKQNVRFNAGPMQMMRSDDAGQTWHDADVAADWQGPHGFFAMAGNDDGIGIVWLDNRDQSKGFQGLRYSHTTDGGTSWKVNQTLDKQTCSCCWNTTHYDHNGNLYVLYRDKKPSDMAIAKVSPNQAFQRLSTVGAFNWDFDGCPHIGGSIAFDQQQTIHTLVGTAHDEYAGVHYQYSKDGGLTWSASQQMGDDTAVHSDIAVTKANHVVATWDYMTEHGLQVVYATKQLDDKQWSDAQIISTQEKSATHPRVLAFEDSALIVWTEKDLAGKHVLKTKVLSFESPQKEVTKHVHAFDKGAFKQIQKSNLGKPHVVLFWSETCTFCMKEMTMLGELLAEGATFSVTSIGTDFGLDDQTIDKIHIDKGLASIEKWIFANPIVESLYFDVDRRWRGELPLLFLIDQNGEAIKHRGTISKQQLNDWSQLVSTP
jgi:thiol-disulfide isomerase/thioredoxin